MTVEHADWRDRVLRARAPRRYLVPKDRIVDALVVMITVVFVVAIVVWVEWVDPCSFVRHQGGLRVFASTEGGRYEVETPRGVCVINVPPGGGGKPASVPWGGRTDQWVPYPPPKL